MKLPYVNAKLAVAIGIVGVGAAIIWLVVTHQALKTSTPSSPGDTSVKTETTLPPTGNTHTSSNSIDNGSNPATSNTVSHLDWFNV